MNIDGVQPAGLPQSLLAKQAEPIKPAKEPETFEVPKSENLPVSASPTELAPSFLAGRISLDLHFAMAASSVTEVRDGNSMMRTESFKAFSADYSFDFAFLKKMDNASGKLAEISPDLFTDFMDTASKLTSLEDGDLNNFLDAVDKLFGELKTILGDNLDFLDEAKNLFKDTIASFFSMVQDEVENFALPENNLQGLEQLPPADGNEDGVETKPKFIDYGKILNDVMEEFDNNLFKMLEDMFKKMPRLIEDQQMLIEEQLKNKAEETGENKQDIGKNEV